MRKIWKGMFMFPHMWENVFMAYRAGYDACGAMLLPRGGKGPKNEVMESPALWDNVRRACASTGIFLDGIGNCIIDDNDNLHPYGMGYSPDPEDLREYFEFAEKKGIEGGVQTSIWTTNEDLALEKFAHLCDVCGDYGLTVNLEFVSWGICDNLAKARKVLEAVNKPNARITLDLMHLYYSNVSPDEIRACPPEWFAEYHLCDVPHVIFPHNHEDLAKEGRSYRLFPGQSGVDLTPWIRAIPNTTMIVPEIPHKERSEKFGPMEYAFKTIERCKQYYTNNHIPL